MRNLGRIAVFAAGVMLAACVVPGQIQEQAQGQTAGARTETLRMQARETTRKLRFPRFLSMYKVLDGAKTDASARALKGTLTIENHSANFSEVLWMLAYWKGECPANDIAMKSAHVIWSDIQKNPLPGASSFPVNLRFPAPLPVTGCVGLVFEGGPVMAEADVTMSADLELEYEPVSTQNRVVSFDGEYCFGQAWGCQDATVKAGEGFAAVYKMPEGRMAGLYGNISDSAFDGTKNFGPLPAGKSWGAVNEFYLLRGGCGRFGQNLNGNGYSNAVPLATLREWLPADAVRLDSVPLKGKVARGGAVNAALETRVEKVFPAPVKVNAGDCVVALYGRTGNGASDNETQVKAVMTP